MAGMDVEFNSFWMVLLWLVFDIFGTIRCETHIGHIAHIAGLAAGAILAVLLLNLGWIKMEKGERSLLQIIWGEESDKR